MNNQDSLSLIIIDLKSEERFASSKTKTHTRNRWSRKIRHKKRVKKSTQEQIIEHAHTHNSYISTLRGAARENLVKHVFSQMKEKRMITEFFMTDKGGEDDRKGIDCYVHYHNHFYPISIVSPFDLKKEKEKHPHLGFISVDLHKPELSILLSIEDQIERILFDGLRARIAQQALNILMADGTLFRYEQGERFPCEHNHLCHYKLITMNQRRMIPLVVIQHLWEKGTHMRYPSALMCVVNMEGKNADQEIVEAIQFFFAKERIV